MNRIFVFDLKCKRDISRKIRDITLNYFSVFLKDGYFLLCFKTEEKFVKMMNDKARELWMYNTIFKKWYFGHWHRDEEIYYKFRAVYFDLLGVSYK